MLNTSLPFILDVNIDRLSHLSLSLSFSFSLSLSLSLYIYIYIYAYGCSVVKRQINYDKEKINTLNTDVIKTQKTFT